jgi:excisionase family DNA binding protein
MKRRSKNDAIEPATLDKPNVGLAPAEIEGRGVTRSSRRPPRYLTIDDVAVLFDVSTRTVRRWIEADELVVHTIGKVVRISQRDLDDFSARHRGR